MHQRISILTFSFLLFFTSTFSIELKEILGTQNYLLVGYRDCEVTIETSLVPMLCPYHVSGSNSCANNKGCSLNSPHPFLWTPGHHEEDPGQVPKLFVLYLEHRKLAAKYITVPMPHFKDGSARALEIIYMGAAKSNNINVAKVTHRDFIYISKIKDILYDEKTSDLYVIGNDDELSNYKVFYYKIMAPTGDGETFELIHQSTFKLPEIGKHLSGVSYDSYADKFYFHIKKKQSSDIYSFDTSIFRRTVEDFNKWKFETNFIPVLNVSVISDGILYINDNPGSGHSRHFIGPLSRNQTAILCRSPTDIRDEKLFIIKDYDYCRVYSDKNYSKEGCEYLIAQGRVGSSEGNNDSEGTWSRLITWIIVISLLLNLIFVVILILRCSGSNNNKSPNLSQKIKKDKNGKIEYYPTYLSDQSGFSF